MHGNATSYKELEFLSTLMKCDFLNLSFNFSYLLRKPRSCLNIVFILLYFPEFCIHSLFALLYCIILPFNCEGIHSQQAFNVDISRRIYLRFFHFPCRGKKNSQNPQERHIPSTVMRFECRGNDH